MAIASTVTGVISYIAVQLFQLQSADQSFLATFPKFMTIIFISAFAYLGLSKYFKLEEANPVINRITRVLFARFAK